RSIVSHRAASGLYGRLMKAASCSTSVFAMGRSCFVTLWLPVSLFPGRWQVAPAVESKESSSAPLLMVAAGDIASDSVAQAPVVAGLAQAGRIRLGRQANAQIVAAPFEQAAELREVIVLMRQARALELSVLRVGDAGRDVVSLRVEVVTIFGVQGHLGLEQRLVHPLRVLEHVHIAAQPDEVRPDCLLPV